MSDLLHVRQWHDGATMPLIIPVSVLVNTPPDVLFSHIKENSAHAKKWIRQEKAHDGIALLCGSGPSLKDDLEEIKQRQKMGALVFALNAAAKYLNENGVYPDYQVVIDAKEESVSLVGPAREHLFGATVNPECFKIKPDATLFQLQVDDDALQDEIDNLAPHEYAMMSTAVSVGVVSIVLAFTMGYRELHFYGYDSCHKDDQSHVVRQSMNDVVACMDVEFAGKKYISSFPMKLQAERFMQVANLLKQTGCTLEMHGSGLLPDMFNLPYEDLSEKDKYNRMWSMLSYRQCSPAEMLVDKILEQLKPEGTIIDFGCGTGRAAARIAQLGHKVTLVDFASNCRDQEAEGLPFVELDLTEPIPIRAKNGYCIDVMEHIPSEMVSVVVKNIMQAAQKVFFQISTMPDKCGVTIGHELHLTIQPHGWWKFLFEGLGYKVAWEEKTQDAALFVILNQGETYEA